MVAENAEVADTVYVGPFAKICGNCKLSGEAFVFGNAWVFDRAEVSGRAEFSEMPGFSGTPKSRVTQRYMGCRVFTAMPS